MSSADPVGPTPAEVADELVRCRRRGLGRLDAVLGSEPPIALPVLESLSARRTGRPATDRGVAIGTLLREGIAALSADRPEDGQMLTELFFGDSPSMVPAMGPGDLLDAAVRRRRPGLSEAAFRRERRRVCERLGRVLIDQAAAGAPDADARVQTGASAVLALARDPTVRHEEVIEHLREMAGEYAVGEVLEVIIRFDTPDILG